MRTALARTLLLLVLGLAAVPRTALATDPDPDRGPESPLVADAPTLPSLSKAITKLIGKKRIPGAIVLVEHKGKLIHFDAQGMRDIEESDPLATDDILRIYSMTKPVVSVAVLMLVEEGHLKLDDPVAKHIPELAKLKIRKKRRAVTSRKQPTVRQLLTHTAGMTYGFFSGTAVDKAYMKDHPLFSENSKQMVTKLGQLPLLYPPGEKWHYSIATDVLGHLVERVSGQQLGDFLEERIFEPLGMPDTAFHVAPTSLKRFASVYAPGLRLHESYRKSPFLEPKTLQSGGGGLVSTAADYLQFCRMLLHEGELGGTRLLRADTVAAMTRDQLPANTRANGLGFGYGVGIVTGNWGPLGHRGEYGWSGAASTHFWISPEDDLIVIALTQHWPFVMDLQNAVKPLVYRAIAQ